MVKTKRSLAWRFLTYQNERFPILVILVTGLAVVLSSAALVIPEDTSLLEYYPHIFLSLVVSILFMFHIRVVDEHRDFKFDSNYHTTRPVQRGLISLKELLFLNTIGLIVQFTINYFFSLKAIILWMLAFSYTIISGKDFFLEDKIKRKFFLYNSLNLVQLLIFQFYLYAIFDPNFSFSNGLLFTHFIFALSNVLLLELARKVKSSREESKAGDTYSARLGLGGSLILLVGTALFTFILFAHIFFKLSQNLFFVSIGIFSLNLLVFSSIVFVLRNNKKSEIFIQGASAIFYIVSHLLLAFSRT